MDVWKSLDLSRRRVLISGASAGIGRAMAMAFADAGAQLVLLDVNESGLASVCRELEGGGCAPVRRHTIDLGNKEEVDAFWDESQAHGPIDTLVNNAGIYPMRKFLEVDEPQFERVMQVNLESLFWMCQGFIRTRGAGGGVIINVSSIEAVSAFKSQMVSYATSKAGSSG